MSTTDDKAPSSVSPQPKQNRSKRPTILDVAREAGVSRQTVTRAMNGMLEIHPETRERVLAASERLGYRPSRFAANLARQKSRAIGLSIDTLRNPYYTDLAADLLDEFARHDWQVVIVAEEHKPDHTLVAKLSTQVDAIVGYFSEEDEQALANAARGVPLILFERTVTQPGLHSVNLDFEDGMRQFIDGLRDRGSKVFGMIESHKPDVVYRPSLRRRCFETFAGSSAADRIVGDDETMAGGAAAFEALLANHPEIDTVVVFNDLMALGAIQRAHQMGLVVPRDVRIAGIDGLSLGAVVSPPLTTLSIDRVAIAAVASRLVNDLLGAETPATSVTNLTVTPHPEWRESA